MINLVILHLLLSDFFCSHSNDGFDISLSFFFLEGESRLNFGANIHYTLN